MENETKFTAALEISSEKVKVLLGYAMRKTPIVLFYKEIPHLAVQGGRIIDKDNLVETLRALSHYEDASLSLKIDTTQVSLILPPLAFQVFQCERTTNIISQDSIIDRVDISNVISLVKKERVPDGNIIVDIVPDYFSLEDGTTYDEPPIGVKSDSLSIQAKVHTLPKDIFNSYRGAVEDANIRVKRTSIMPYAVAELYKSMPDVPQTYLYIEFGARLTTLSLIGEGKPYSSLFFQLGSGDLTDEISSKLNLAKEDARNLKEKYGYDPDIHKFELPLIYDQEKKNVIYQKDLNRVIEDFFTGYKAKLKNAVETLFRKHDITDLNAVPYIVMGNGVRLKNFDSFFKDDFPPFLHPKCPAVGLKDYGCNALLGLLLIEAGYKGTLEDNYRTVGLLSRREDK